MEETYGGAIDCPDERDYWAEQILGDNDIVIPESFRLDLKEGNQATPTTKSSCTLFSAYHAAQIANELEHGKEIDPWFEKGWEEQGKFGTRTSNGDSLQTALKSLVKNGLITPDKVYPIDGYARVEKSKLKNWLTQKHAIITCADVTSTNFKKAKYEGIWPGIDGEIKTGHAFILIGFEPGYYIASNSYGSDYGFYKDGTFKIPETLINSLGSTYIIYDHPEVAYIFKDVTTKAPFADDIFWAKNAYLVNGYADGSFRPNQPITRAEFCAILHRYDNSKKS